MEFKKGQRRLKEKSITFWELVLMNVSALYGIRWIAKSTSDSFGLGLGAIPMWIIFMLIFFVPQALMCAELATAYPTDGGLNDWVKIAFGTKIWIFSILDALDGTYFLVCIFSDIFLNQFYLHDWETRTCR